MVSTGAFKSLTGKATVAFAGLLHTCQLASMAVTCRVAFGEEFLPLAATVSTTESLPGGTTWAAKFVTWGSSCRGAAGAWTAKDSSHRRAAPCRRWSLATGDRTMTGAAAASERGASELTWVAAARMVAWWCARMVRDRPECGQMLGHESGQRWEARPPALCSAMRDVALQHHMLPDAQGP